MRRPPSKNQDPFGDRQSISIGCKSILTAIKSQGRTGQGPKLGKDICCSHFIRNLKAQLCISFSCIMISSISSRRYLISGLPWKSGDWTNILASTSVTLTAALLCLARRAHTSTLHTLLFCYHEADRCFDEKGSIRFLQCIHT